MLLCSELILDLITYWNNYSRSVFTERNTISKVVACFLWVLLFLKWLLLSLASTFHQHYPSALVTLPALAHAHSTALHTGVTVYHCGHSSGLMFIRQARSLSRSWVQHDSWGQLLSCIFTLPKESIFKLCHCGLMLGQSNWCILRNSVFYFLSVAAFSSLWALIAYGSN